MGKRKCEGFIWYHGDYKVEISRIREIELNEKVKVLKIITPYVDRYGNTIEIELEKFYKNSRLIGAIFHYDPYEINVPCKIKGYDGFRDILYTMLENIVSLELLSSEMWGKNNGYVK